MSQLDFKRLDELFNQAVTLPSVQWPGFVADACGDDAEGAARLLQMLKADASSSADPLGAAVAVEREHLAQAPSQVGAYRIVRELGRGGMGSVYLAEREQPGFTQQVALKLLRSDALPDFVVARFSQERRLLAGLSHPNIARLIDAGEADDGSPFVAMEYIDGLTLTDYAMQHRLSVRERVKLFGQLCAAIGYAHRNLIVHRDIKPDNVLVDADGNLKLLDFGIAKLLPSDGQSSVGTLTRAGAMTPPYASPEQVRGLAISTQSDIYSLGVVLYQLLVGELPYAVSSDASALELERQICDTEPLPPSRRDPGPVTPKQLRGDLDNIVMKALRKEPQRRYDSVDQLADDLQRYLDGLPVSARADSWAYRARKFVGRNPLAVAASALLVVSLAAFGILSQRQAREVAAQRDRATQEAEAATQVADFMIDLFRVSDHRETASEALTARDLLDRAAVQVEQQIDAAPMQRARLMHTLGLAYVNLGDYNGGLKLLNGALAIREQALGPNSLAVADSLNRIGNFHREYGRYEEAETALRRALEIRERSSSQPSYDLADSYNNFGLFQRQMGDYDVAIQMLQRSIDMHRQISGGDTAAVGYASHNMAQARQSLGQYRQAQQLIEQALTIKRAEGLEERSTYANSLAVLGSIQRARGDLDGALVSRQRSLALRRKIHSTAHPSLVAGIIGLASLQIELGDLASAESLLNEALPLAVQTAGEASNLVARVRAVRGDLLKTQGQPDRAIIEFEQVLAIRRVVMQADNPTLWRSQHDLGLALLQAGHAARAEPLIIAVHQLHSERFAADHPDLLAATVALAELSLAQGQTTQASDLASSVAEQTLTEPSWRAARQQVRAHQLLAELSATDPAAAQHHAKSAQRLRSEYLGE